MTRSRLDRLGLGWVNFSGSHSELTQDDVKINFTNSGSLESLPWNVTGTEHFPPLGLFWSATQNNQLSNQHANLESHGHRCYKTRRWNIHAIYARFCLLAGNKPNISWPIIWIFWSIKFLAVKSTVCEKNKTFLVSRSTFAGYLPPTFRMYHMSYTHSCVFFFFGYITNSEHDQLPVGLIARLVEHRTGIAEVMGSNVVQDWL